MKCIDYIETYAIVPWALLLVLSYLAAIEPILEKLLNVELILEHFWVPWTDALTRKEQKRLLVASYAVSIWILATVFFVNEGAPKG